jgi:acetolactate synthase small subunit
MSAAHSRRTKQLRSTGVEQVVFVIKAENRPGVLLEVVQLCQDLNLEIEALYMIRRRGAETLRIHVTIETNEEGRRQIAARLGKVLDVRSVETGYAGKVLLDHEEADERRASRQSTLK